jgi:hypothetical protein
MQKEPLARSVMAKLPVFQMGLPQPKETQKVRRLERQMFLAQVFHSGHLQ